jgi:hypothetical protein
MKTKFLFREINLFDELCAAAVEQRDLRRKMKWIEKERRGEGEEEPINAVKISSR